MRTPPPTLLWNLYLYLGFSGNRDGPWQNTVEDAMVGSLSPTLESQMPQEADLEQADHLRSLGLSFLLGSRKSLMHLKGFRKGLKPLTNRSLGSQEAQTKITPLKEGSDRTGTLSRENKVSGWHSALTGHGGRVLEGEGGCRFLRPWVQPLPLWNT